MFETTDSPRVFGTPPGVDFPKSLIRGLRARLEGQPPEQLARVEIFVNTRRMQRRLVDLFDAGPACLLPRIRLVTDLALDIGASGIPPAVSPLQRRMELVRLVSALLKSQPGLAPKTSLYDLADSLAALMDEMQGEAVTPETIAQLDVSDQSGHWERSLQFIRILQDFFVAGAAPPDTEARQRAVVEATVSAWKENPPQHPIIIAGSTGSRGATALFMSAVSQLPQGAVILPGYDFDMPLGIWDHLTDAMTGEDHPQFRFAKFMQTAGVQADQINRWCDSTPMDPDRNKLISLSLRPAPVTHQWMTEGPQLGNLQNATQHMTLLEAPAPRIEAVAIAMRLRQAVEAGEVAALITPNRNLTRQVTATLGRWGIVPDDSAGMPLPLSAPGRLLLHVADLFSRKVTPEMLLTLLKHPLTNTGSEQRGDHLRWTRDLELYIRAGRMAFPTAERLRGWADQEETDDGRRAWIDWIVSFLAGLEQVSNGTLKGLLGQHLERTELLAAGPTGTQTSELWGEAAGREALEVIAELQAVSDTVSDLGATDYRSLFRGVLNRGEVRDQITPHPNVLIWGTLEARVQGADVVILGGLNEGIWPEQAAPDPWLNRALRSQAGLLLPERRIGLSAHDYQQAVAAREVWITRSVREADAEAVPSRWLNRLTNLLKGLPDQSGPQALRDMETRGNVWLDRVADFEVPLSDLEPARRPSPVPPLTARPDSLSVTRVRTLIRDPYAIYAEKILRLRPLDPIRQEPDAPLRGIAMHAVFEAFVEQHPKLFGLEGRAKLIEIGEALFSELVPWPMARRVWMAKLIGVSNWFLEAEQRRRETSDPCLFEERGTVRVDAPPFRLTGTADRIDLNHDGRAIVYDYKTGSPPTAKQQKEYDIQVMLEAAMIERNGFDKIGVREVADAIYIGLGSNPKEVPAPLEETSTAQVWKDFLDLLRHYADPDQGYSARRAMERISDYSNYDHLSRFGEWEITDSPEKVRLK